MALNEVSTVYHRLLLAVLLLFAGCLESGSEAWPPDAASPLPEPTTPRFSAPTVVNSNGNAYEPGIRVAPDGTLFVHAHKANAVVEGTTFSSWVWWSRDNGTSWISAPEGLPPRSAFHAFEGDIAFDEAGRAWFLDASQGAGRLTSWRLTPSGPEWESTLPLAVHGTFGDRPWLEARGDGQLLLLHKTPLTPTVDPVGDAGYSLQRSMDKGLTWSLPFVFPESSWCDLAQNPVDPDQVLVGCQVQPLLDLQRIQQVLWESSDGGATFANVFTGPEQIDAANQFVSSAIDEEGNGFHAWIDDSTSDANPAILNLARRINGTWEHLVLPAPNGTLERVGVDARAGRVAVSFSGRLEGETAWHPYVMIANATATSPQWSLVLLDAAPQSEGASSPGDFWQVALAPDGRIHACYGVQLPRPVAESGAINPNEIRCVHEVR